MPSDRDELRALAHPLRLRMLSLLTGAELSAAEVARELGTTQANASYHLRRLLAADLLVDAGDVAVRGGRAHRYRHRPARPPATPAPPPAGSPTRRDGAHGSGRSDPEAVQALTRVLADELVRRGRDRDPSASSHLTDAELWVDPDAFVAASAALTRASVALHDAARPPRTPGTVRVNATWALFAMTGGADPAGPGGPT